jgi:hypothetical protein
MQQFKKHNYKIECVCPTGNELNIIKNLDEKNI